MTVYGKNKLVIFQMGMCFTGKKIDILKEEYKPNILGSESPP